MDRISSLSLPGLSLSHPLTSAAQQSPHAHHHHHHHNILHSHHNFVQHGSDSAAAAMAAAVAAAAVASTTSPATTTSKKYYIRTFDTSIEKNQHNLIVSIAYRITLAAIHQYIPFSPTLIIIIRSVVVAVLVATGAHVSRRRQLLRRPSVAIRIISIMEQLHIIRARRHQYPFYIRNISSSTCNTINPICITSAVIINGTLF